MKKSLKSWAGKHLNRQHWIWSVILAVGLAVGLGFAYVLPSVFAEADSEEGHVHNLLCYEGVELACAEAEQQTEHVHNLSCLAGVSLACTEEHAHNIACFAAASETLVCGVAEGQEAWHMHGQPGYECVAVKLLTCAIPEHSHTEACLPEQPAKQPVLVRPDNGGDGWYVIDTGVEESNDPVQPDDNAEPVPDDDFGGFAGDD
ncbi:MAG: hypothetical protein NC400_14950, partial [Clostridium sp.]|nr:hypothetical protein [Clostridium sp.]